MAAGKGHAAALALAICVAAGLALLVIELTRPFVLMFMPLFLGSVWLMLRGLPRRNFVAFLIPILLLSGGWHAKMLILHGQWHWTNHTGFNMYQSWYGFLEYREYAEAPPRGPHRGKNINTEQHYQWSKELTSEIASVWVHRPGASIAHVGERATQFFAPQTDLGYAKPVHWIFGPYRVVVWAVSLLLFLALGTFAIQLLRRRGRGLLDWLAEPEVLLMLFATYTITIFIVVEAKEDARFLISVLPYLVCLPGLQWMLRGWRREGVGE